jgi:hypothetical protein
MEQTPSHCVVVRCRHDVDCEDVEINSRMCLVRVSLVRPSPERAAGG